MPTQIFLVKGFPGEMVHSWGSLLSPKTVHKTQASSTPTAPLHRTHMLEDKDDWGAEVLGVIVVHKDRDDI